MRFRLVGLAALFALVCVVAVSALLTINVSIGSVGRVKAVGVGVYWDAACTNPVTHINWGAIEPGSSQNVTVYIRNEGNTNVKLSCTTGNWNPPEAEQFLTLTWDYGDQWLAPNAVQPVTFTLSASPNIQGIDNFSFEITISAVG